MIIYLIAITLGMVLLFWSAELFVDGATKVSIHYKMSPLFIGMVVIGFGTSAPEFIVSVMSSYFGQDDIAVGNAYGSNIVNIALILGLTSIIKPIKVLSTILRKELLTLLLVSLFSTYLFIDLKLSRGESLFLLSLFILLFYCAIRESKKHRDDSFGLEVAKSIDQKHVTLKSSYFYLISGLGILILSSRLFSWGAAAIAKSLGVSDVVIGFTIVAIGTSLPELISSIVAAKKSESELAFGNIIGSNLFNTLIVIPCAGLVKPLSISKVVFERDMSVMCLVTLVLLLFGIGARGEGRINRIEGGLFILFYMAYASFLIFIN